jgi:hypothetical protein
MNRLRISPSPSRPELERLLACLREQQEFNDREANSLRRRIASVQLELIDMRIAENDEASRWPSPPEEARHA